MSAARILLHPRRAKPFYARHPWVFSGAIAKIEGEPQDGEAVQIFSHGGTFIAHGLYNGQSRIRIRLYSWDVEQPIDTALFRSRLEQAIQLRRDVLGWSGPGKACRMVFSEGDGLSGLTVDQYDRWLVVQFTSLALARRKEEIIPLLRELLDPAGIYLRTERGIGQQEGVELHDGPLWGEFPQHPIEIKEAGLTYLVHLQEGQKTGFYLDQRLNRQAAARYAAGRRVLDAFCYTGGFSLHAARAGALETLGVDSSDPAIELAKENAARNNLSQATFAKAEVFKFLEEAAQKRERYGLIVLDPPKFARTQSAVETALQGYRRLQALAFLLLEPGGVLVTCCCSGLITMDQLAEVQQQVATDAKRPMQILEKHGQPPDHPVALACPESAYLKCLISRAM
jgi:23S rRNA (cytosine1962-C5)-methyltransferase